MVSTGRPDDRARAARLLVAADGHEPELHDGQVVVSVPESHIDETAASHQPGGVRRGMVLVELSPRRTTLEDRYLELVDGSTR